MLISEIHAIGNVTRWSRRLSIKFSIFWCKLRTTAKQNYGSIYLSKHRFVHHSMRSELTSTDTFIVSMFCIFKMIS